MIIAACKVYLTAEWAGSLKEKRIIVKSITERVRNKFNVSIAEVEEMDIWQRIVLGFACVSNDAVHGDNMAQNILRFIERSTDAVVDFSETEMIRL